MMSRSLLYLSVITISMQPRNSEQLIQWVELCVWFTRSEIMEIFISPMDLSELSELNVS